MAKTKSQSQSEQKKLKKKQAKAAPQKTPEELYALAIESLERSEPEKAQSYAQDLLSQVDPDLISSKSLSDANPNKLSLPVLNLLGEISVELGDVDNARRYFLLAVKVDPDGGIADEAGGGAEKFLWLAQLSEEGGADSVRWYERGVAALKAQIDALRNTPRDAQEKEVLENEKRASIATALCSVVEVYMTDLSWEDDAEARCESLVIEALAFAPDSAEVLQTLASVRLSQLKQQDAQLALTRSMGLWKNLDPEDDEVPDYPTRISLARLLMEAEMEDEAMVVLERLALEDDQSVEACYLGGWCLYLLAEKRRKTEATNDVAYGHNEANDDTLKASRKWLLNTIKLYQLQEYEDDRLRDHTTELVGELNKILGPIPEDADADEEAEEWADEEDSEDEEMAGT